MNVHQLLAVVAFCIPILAGAQTCYESAIQSPTPFMGNNGEIFRLTDGTLWEVKYEYEYLYEYYPQVVICPGRGMLIVGGKKLNVQQVSGGGSRTSPSRSPLTPDVIESRIDGDFSGWEGETIFKLENGQIWQQSSYAYLYSYKYQPKVLIFRSGGGFEMQVEGIDGRIRVVRLK